MRGSQQDNDAEGESVYDKSYAAANGCLSHVFSSCSDDPRGSIHRAWGVSLLFILAYFIVSVVESTYSRVECAQGTGFITGIAEIWSSQLFIILFPRSD
jgi:hypothetical protein